MEEIEEVKEIYRHCFYVLRAGSQVPFLYFLHFLSILYFLQPSFEQFVSVRRKILHGAKGV